MPIRWSAKQVSESLDELERLLGQAEPILGELVQKAQETINLPNTPEYINQPLGWLKQKTLDYIEYQHQRIQRVRDYIPKEALAKEQDQFQKFKREFGDDNKAQLAMSLFGGKK